MAQLTPVSPTKGNLISSKKTAGLATMGYEMMDRKRNILIREMMALIDRANALRSKIDDTYREAYEALQKAQITLGVCELIALSVPIEDSLKINFRSVMGVELPIISISDVNPPLCYDISGTNSAFDSAYLRFYNVKLMTAELAEIENCVYRLAVAIKKTQSRANALKNIIIPELEQTIRYITDALEEKEREEFSRLKVVKAGKEKR